jgi:murein tripeptide amidase MpaA
MKFQRVAAMVVTTAASAVAFTPSGRSFLGRSVVESRFSSISKGAASSLSMNIFERFFGGGANALRIDYSKLDHPGPELAAWASANIMPAAHSTRDPHLRLATFAGGCFWGLELAYQRVPGVVYTATGYTQGSEEGG